MGVDIKENLCAALVRWPSIVCDQGQVVDICDIHDRVLVLDISETLHAPHPL